MGFVNVDPAALQEASGAVTSALTECEAMINQVMAARTALDSSISSTLAATNKALAGWTQGAGYSAFEGAQTRLRSHEQSVDNAVQQLQTIANVLHTSLTEFQAALAKSGTAYSENDAAIAASWAPVE